MRVTGLQRVVDDHARARVERDAGGLKTDALDVWSPTHTDENLVDGNLTALTAALKLDDLLATVFRDGDRSASCGSHVAVTSHAHGLTVCQPGVCPSQDRAVDQMPHETGQHVRRSP